ncbi:MAG: hypothetical protein LAO05_05430, partial [Acidobacteriia bacterium]|nr:hypothetical protein [Terriglobia bacterium]
GFTGRVRGRRLLLAGGLLIVAALGAALTIWRPWYPVPKPVGQVPERVPSVLALPCKVYGAPDVAFLTDAVPGTISTLLAQVEGLDTKVPPTSLEVEKVKGDLARLAELYDVSSFIVTSIDTSTGRFALNVQLVDAATRKVRWGRQYEGPRGGYNDLARDAADGIRQAVNPAAPPVPAPRVSSEAELAFREGTFYFDRYHTFYRPVDFESAVAAFTRALALDSSFAIAAGKIAGLFAARLLVEGDVHDLRDQVESCARRALGIDPRCGEAWSALSLVEAGATHADPERATDHAVKAVTFAPRDASAHLILAGWMPTGSLGLAASLHSAELNPFLFNADRSAAFNLCLLGRPGDALTLLDRVLRVQPDWVFGLLTRSSALTTLGRLEEAESTLRRCEAAANAEQLPREGWRVKRFALAVAQRDTALSEALAQQIIASVLDSRASANLVDITACSAAPALAHMGRTDDAIRILEKSVEVGYPPPYDWLLVDPDIQLLRNDPRFAKVLAGTRDSAAMTARVFGQARARGELPSYLNQPLDQLVKLLKDNEGTN